MTTTWLENITDKLFDSLSLEDKGTLPIFPLESFSSSLSKNLGKPVSIRLEKVHMLESSDFYKDLGNKTLSSPLCFSGIDHFFSFSMPIEDVQFLLSYMEKNENEQNETLIIEDESLVKGLYTYFITEAIDVITQLNVYKDLQLKITDKSINFSSAKCLDISIELENKKLMGRFFIPEDFEKALNSHFSFVKPTLANLEQIPHCQIPLTITTGSVELNPQEIQELNAGDFLIFHNSFYKPNDQKGSFQLLVGKTPLFQIKMQKDGFKVLDYLYFYNEETMEGQDENFDELEKEQHPPQEEQHQEPPQEEEMSEKDLLDQELATDEFASEPEEKAPEHQQPIDLEAIDKEIAQADTEFEEEKPSDSPEKTSLASVPLTIQMEVARFSLSLEELKKMSPGHKLPININPLKVHLVISGRSIGTGEVIQTGDTIGVRIVELNK